MWSTKQSSTTPFVCVCTATFIDIYLLITYITVVKRHSLKDAHNDMVLFGKSKWPTWFPHTNWCGQHKRSFSLLAEWATERSALLLFSKMIKDTKTLFKCVLRRTIWRRAFKFGLVAMIMKWQYQSKVWKHFPIQRVFNSLRGRKHTLTQTKALKSEQSGSTTSPRADGGRLGGSTALHHKKQHFAHTFTLCW